MTMQTRAADRETTVADIRKVWTDSEINVAIKGNQASIVEFVKASAKNRDCLTVFIASVLFLRRNQATPDGMPS